MTLPTTALALFILTVPGIQAASVENPVIYSEDHTAASTIQDRDPGYRPMYLVYSDNQTAAEQGKALLEALGLPQHLREYKTRAFVVGPVNGTAYEDPADLTAYQNFLKSHRSSNLKIIAVGAGATFVNNVISKHAYSVAGILTYGGSIAPGAASNIPVPVYVHALNPGVAKYYIAANGNPGPQRALQRVVASKLSDSDENLAQAFQNAWKKVFSRNYRLYMSRIESYNPAFDPLKYTEPWELEPYVMYDELGIHCEAVTEDLPGFGLTLRYEYIPEKARTAAPKSLPLVIMMHGNTNDPRIQGESAGWPEVAAKNTIILASIEWQGRTSQEKIVFPPIGEAGTMAILDRLLAKYPQVDPSRVYLTGLSAGAMNSFAWGINNVSRIAAVEGSSAPFGAAALIEAAKKVKRNGNYLPAYSIAGTHDMYKPLPVSDSPRTFYNVIRAFAVLDDLQVPDAPDLKVNEYFGLKLDGPGWSELGGTRAMMGTLSNNQGVMMKLIALDPYGHWNFKPAAADMWDFLSRYRRDLTTGKLQIR
ncbi:MAG TPA: PHB depolymerase family esterase [Bryobacteraceae bacterium]|nr:PHB depolymerase family esterase [Bryobacteraceae bacterium]